MTGGPAGNRAGSVALAAALALGLATRWPDLQRVPHLTDEAGEVLYARAILGSGGLPLVHNDAYNGAFWAWLMAAWLAAWPADAAAPRALALLLGLATVAATFLLAWRMARPGGEARPALLAAGLMATAFTPSLVNGRVSWSNSATPLWTTLCAAALLAAVRAEGSPRPRALRWLGAGLLGGLAMQSHPSAIVLLLGLAAWLFLDADRRSWWRRRGPWLALAGALVAYSPVIVFNLRDGFQTLAEARGSSNWAEGGPSPAAFATAFVQLGRSIVGGFDLPAGGLAPPPEARDPWLAALWAAAYAAAALLVARGRAARHEARRLPLVVLLVALAGLPFFNQNWRAFLEARYVGFVLPPLAAAMGLALGGLLDDARGPGRRRSLWLAMALLLAVPALRGAAYRQRALAEGFDNRRLWAMLEEAREASAAGAAVLVDEDLRNVAWRAGGHPRRAVEYLLTMADIPFDRVRGETINHRLQAHESPPPLCFMAGDTASHLEAWGNTLDPVDVEPRPGEGPWGLWRGVAQPPGGS